MHDIYRHPNALGELSTSFEIYIDMYSLGTLMVEIAEWLPLKHVVRKCADVTEPKPNAGIILNAIASIAP